MKKLPYLLHIVFALLVLLAGCQHGPKIDQPEITTQELSKHIYFLASDSLKGRYPGTPEADVAAAYIRDHFEKDGLTLLGDHGFDFFEVTVNVKAGPNNTLKINGQSVDRTNFTPMSFSASDSTTGEVVFAGYGFEINEGSLKWNDYAGLNVKGKWVLVLRGDPEPDDLKSPFAKYSKDRDKAMTAMDKGASGILFVSGSSFDTRDELDKLRKNVLPVSIPAFQITRKTADAMLKGSGKKTAQLEHTLMKSRKPASFALPGTRVTGRAEILEEKVSTCNVIAKLEGTDPVLKDQYIVIGGHYDHLGMGGPNTGSRRPDTIAIHYGADDNASGTASVIELAEKFASLRDSIRRSIIFVAFGAEEMGLLGSKHLVNSNMIDLKKVDAMINIDMVGRLKPNGKLEIGGTGTSPISDSLLKATPGADLFKLAMSPEGYGPSDHASFYGKEIPVFFFSTGSHLDYHTPFDTPDKINYEGLKKVDDYIFNLAYELANIKQKLTFRMAGPKEGSGMSRRGFKVTLGIMPDYAGEEKSGLRVDLVIPGRPAALAGMKNGDIITAVNGQKVKNIYDYMYRLAKLHHGETITVEIIRNGEKKVLLVQL